MLFEVNQAEQEYIDNKHRFTQLVISYLILLPCVMGFSFAAAWVISASIYIPIKKLHDVTTTITTQRSAGAGDQPKRGRDHRAGHEL